MTCNKRKLTLLVHVLRENFNMSKADKVDGSLFIKFKQFYVFVKQLELELAPNLSERSYNCYKEFFERSEKLFAKYNSTEPVANELLKENIHQMHMWLQSDYDTMKMYMETYPEPKNKKNFKVDVADILDCFMKDGNNPINMDNFSSPAKSDCSSERMVSPSKTSSDAMEKETTPKDTSADGRTFDETRTPPESKKSN